jgi:uncharacterized peroxidase-related enzyme
MAYIKSGINQTGITQLLFYKRSSGKALSNLAHTLLHGPSSLSKGERELIASYVSKLNDCNYCHGSHGAAANVHLNDNGKTLSCVIDNPETSDVSDKIKALLNIAKKAKESGKNVLQEDIDRAKQQGANDEDIHDTVLIASAFCMFNRYVDGLNTGKASDSEYIGMGNRLAKKGYKYPPRFLIKYVINKINKAGSNR